MSWRVIAVGALAALAGCLLAVGVAAHTTHSSSALQLNVYTSGSVSNYVWGVVSSPNPRCVAGRRVRVYRKAPGPDPEFGSDISLESPSGNGPYTVTAPTGDLPEGLYYSQLRKRDLRPGRRHAHICKGARSNEQVVGP
ncbi:MAG: hypothetical protein ABI726_06075 [bacterium]